MKLTKTQYKKLEELMPIYMKFNRWVKNGTIAKATAFFLSLKLRILAAMKKQKLFNKENSALFIDSTSIKVSPDANRNRNTQKQSIGCSR